MTVGLFAANRTRIVIILASNFLISVLQSNLASLFSLVGPDFGQGVAGLGIASSLMFLGICLAEIPGGILEVRIGARNAISYMMFLCAASSIVGSLTSSFTIFLVTRFTVGIGIGAAFPPVIVVLTRYFKSGSEGAAIGWNSLSYNLGTVTGLAGWAVLGSILGWRVSLILGGALSIMLGILLMLSLPRLELGLQSFMLSIRDLKLAFSNRQISLLTISLFGIGASSNLTINFLVYFLETQVNLSASVAGLIGGTGPIFAFTAPFIGRYYDKTGRLRFWMLLSSFMVAVGVAITALGTVSAGLLSSVLVAVGASTGYTIGLTRAREIGKSIRTEYESVAVAWTDSLSLLGGFIAPVIFSAIVTRGGYEIAWISGALFALILVFALYA
jgi:predicted MFS family arabinose efflux permease